MPSTVATFDAARAARYDHEIPHAIPGYGVLHALTAAVCAAGLAEAAAPGGAGPRVLLAGAGTGAELAALAAVGPAWRFVAADPSADMLAHLRARAAALRVGDRLTVHRGEVATLPAEPPFDVPFDAATLLLVLHFVPDDGAKLALLAALARRLRPGAPLLLADMVGEPGTPSFERLLGAWTAHLRLSAGAPEPAANTAAAEVRAQLHWVSERRLTALLVEAGFEPPVRYWQGLLAGAWVARAAG